MTFSQLIREACRKQGVSGYELAKRLGAHPTYGKQLLDSKSITERTLRRCAKALGLEVECRLVKKRNGK